VRCSAARTYSAACTHFLGGTRASTACGAAQRGCALQRRPRCSTPSTATTAGAQGMLRRAWRPRAPLGCPASAWGQARQHRRDAAARVRAPQRRAAPQRPPGGRGGHPLAAGAGGRVGARAGVPRRVQLCGRQLLPRAARTVHLSAPWMLSLERPVRTQAPSQSTHVRHTRLGSPQCAPTWQHMRWSRTPVSCESIVYEHFLTTACP